MEETKTVRKVFVFDRKRIRVLNAALIHAPLCQSSRSLPWLLSVHEWPSTAWSIFMGFQRYPLQDILLIFVFLPHEARDLLSTTTVPWPAVCSLPPLQHKISCDLHRMPAARKAKAMYPNLKIFPGQPSHSVAPDRADVNAGKMEVAGSPEWFQRNLV